ncbi:DNA repair protein REV1, partial [Orchesella cincta]
KVPGSTPEDLATFLRKIILENTNCPASIGIGSNRLLAKLAVKLAKPDGVHHLKDCDAKPYIQSLQVRDLPGVGWSNEDKLLDNFGVKTCSDLLKIPLKDLKSLFGEKTAEKMLSLCKGVDSSEIKTGLERPKSISVDVNFMIRFTKDDEVTNFLINICKELSTRAEKMQATSTHFSLKLLIRKKGAGDPLKHGGHGIVDSMTRSRSLMTPTRNWQELYKTACSLTRLMRVPPTEYRGIGVTLTDLKFDDDKSTKKSIQRTLTEMPISRAQKMLTISQKKSKTAGLSSENTSSPDVSQESPIPIENGAPGSALHSDKQVVPADYSVAKSSAVQAPPSDTTTNEPVDINMLRQLPREIAEEQCQIFGISKDVLDIKDDSDVDTATKSEGATSAANGTEINSYYDNVDTIDSSFLQALPDSVRQDVLIQLQEAKGRKAINGDLQYDEQQPCSSKQALERDKQREKLHNGDGNPGRADDCYNLEIREQGIDLSKSHKGLPLDQQVTPKIYYNRSPRFQLEPSRFWDMSTYCNLLPSKDIQLPALNNCTDVADVRNLIRDGLETLKDPTAADVECLEKYFTELIAQGWIQQAATLLKFLNRQYEQLDDADPWVPLLAQVLEEAQNTWRALYQGEIQLDDEYQ